MKWRLQLCFFSSTYCLLKFAKEKQHMQGYGELAIQSIPCMMKNQLPFLGKITTYALRND
jgi:hypothetical protein